MKRRRPTAANPGLERALSSLLPLPLRPGAEAPTGRRRRARLLLLLGAAGGAKQGALLRAAAAVEAVHLAALIHDDVLDDAAVRRGRAALHRTVKRGAALLLGDILFSRAVASIHRLGRPALTARFLRAVDDTCAGEILETAGRGRPPWTEGLYFRIAGLKTAALFRFCGEAAALLAGRRDWSVWGSLSRRIGIACQIIDDCLDLAPPGFPVGKDRLSDLKNFVPSLPAILGLADRRTAPAVRAALGAADRGRRERAGRALRRDGHLRRAADRAEARLRSARSALRRAGAGERLSPYLGELDDRLRAIREWRP